MRIIFLISPEFSSEDKVESLLVLLGCFVMFRHNLLGLLGSRPCQRHCGLQQLEMYFFGFSLFNCGQASHVAIDINKKDPPLLIIKLPGGKTSQPLLRAIFQDIFLV